MKKRLIFIICFILIISFGGMLLLNQYCIRDKKPLQFDSVKKVGIEGLRKYYRIPGLAYCIIKDGKIIEMNALGYIFEGSDMKVTMKINFKLVPAANPIPL